MFLPSLLVAVGECRGMLGLEPTLCRMYVGSFRAWSTLCHEKGSTRVVPCLLRRVQVKSLDISERGNWEFQNICLRSKHKRYRKIPTGEVAASLQLLSTFSSKRLRGKLMVGGGDEAASCRRNRLW